MKLNAQQEQVVKDPVGNLLVSAAAGSGKTSVMTERIASRVISGDLDLRRILVMTFTNAAASNMRKKVEEKLLYALSIETDALRRAHISEQLTTLSSAHISTIHSFCLRVIDNFSYEARTDDGEPVIDPGYMTLDETRAKLLLKQAIDDVLSSLYEEQYEVGQASAEETITDITMLRDKNQPSPFILDGDSYDTRQWFLDFERMIASFGSRNDEAVRNMIRSIHSLLRSMPEYENWLREALAKLKQTSVDYTSSLAAKVLLSDFQTALLLCETDLTDLEKNVSDVLFVKDKKKNADYQEMFLRVFLCVRRLVDQNKAGLLTYGMCRDVMAQLPEYKFPSRKKADPDDIRATFMDQLQSVKEVLSYLGSGKPDPKTSRTNVRFLFAKSEKEIEDELAIMVPVISRLLETVILTDDQYTRLKRSENAIDFSDYEHLALLILNRPDAKAYYSSQFDEIYIDEYQDNSRIQDAIVACFSRENCFAVGDVKQSIYRFRHARPQIFLNRLRQYSETGAGVVRELNSNYRSDPRILSVINDIFEQIMSKASGEIDYDHTQRLTPGIKETHTFDEAPAVELLLLDVTKQKAIADELDKDGDAGNKEMEEPSEAFEEEGNTDVSASSNTLDNEEVDPEKTEKEARMVIEKIRELSRIDGVSWSDFAILCRKNKEVEIFTAALNNAGIPAEGKTEDEYLSSRELLLMENFIRLLDNFNQDIPLASVMRSSFPQAGFTDEELLLLKLDLPPDLSGQGYFYQAVLYARQFGSDLVLRDKVRCFCDWIDSLRSASMYLRVSELIERIYYETGIREQVSTFPDGASRVVTLEAFRDWAGRFDSGRNGGLYRFVSYMQNLRDRKESPEEFVEAQLATNVVRCMTVHKSKGLEYRVVFLTGIGKSFIKKDAAKEIMLSEVFGVTTKFIDPDDGLYFETHLSMASEDEEMSAELAEQMRVLYVALTRAQEKLYLTSCFERNKDGEFTRASELIQYAAQQTDISLPAWLVKKSKSFLDLCLLAFARNPNLDLQPILSTDGSKTLTLSPVVSSSRSKDINLSIIDFENIRSKPNGIEPSLTVPVVTTSLPETLLSDRDRELFTIQCDGKYRYESLTQAPAKITVSELKRRSLPKTYLAEDQEETAVSACVPTNIRPINLSVKAPAEQETAFPTKLSPTERGTLLHSVFQYLDFTRLTEDPSINAVESAIQALVDAKMLRKDRLVHIEPYHEAIRAFAASDICRRLVAAESRIQNGPYREIPFSLAMSSDSEDLCMVQGMIDCWFLEGKEAVLLDYKTDALRGTYEEKKAILYERYATQLDYYARAITSASGLPVKERIIWLIPDAVSFLLEAPGKNH